MKELLQNPEKYRIGSNFRASNIVFPVNYKGRDYVVKKPRKLSSMINSYYSLQARHFYNDRKPCSGKEAIAQEISKLSKLEGICSPKLLAHNDSLLVKEYVQGFKLNQCNSIISKIAFFENAVVSLKWIHGHDMVVGDANIKNAIKNYKGFHWIDFDGVFDEQDLTKAKALDLMKMVYSTYTVTRDIDYASYAAMAVRLYGDSKVKKKISELVNPGLGTFSAWFSTRATKKANKQIKQSLEMVCSKS